jgi:fatty acid kinase fatty acid binding subunit
MKIALVADSTCDLPADIVAVRGIEIVPLHILWGTENYADGVDITNDILYERLKRDPILPTTSQAAPGEFVDKYRQARDKHQADAVVCITVGSRLSGTYAAAELAAGLVDFPVRVIDSCTVTISLGFVVLAAANARDRGGSLEEVVKTAQDAADHSKLVFTLDTLEFLHRGGRIGGARRFIGTALNLKPILSLREGVVEPVETVRTRKRAVAELIELAMQYQDKRPLWFGMLHTHAPEVETVSNELRERLKPEMFLQVLASPAVGVHAGPAAIGFGLVYGAQ